MLPRNTEKSNDTLTISNSMKVQTFLRRLPVIKSAVKLCKFSLEHYD